VWLYILAVIEALIVLVVGSLGPRASTAMVFGVVGPLILLKVLAARNVGRFERGAESAPLLAVRYLRYLLATITIEGAIIALLSLSIIGRRVLRLPA
jgi:hypothetical protein